MDKVGCGLAMGSETSTKCLTISHLCLIAILSLYASEAKLAPKVPPKTLLDESIHRVQPPSN
jgi:hypothetical protein